MTIARKALELKITILRERKEVMVTYLQAKTAEQDWHGVADAAMDLREIETELATLQRILGS